MALPVPTTSGKNARCCFARKDLQPEGGSKVRDIPIVTKDCWGLSGWTGAQPPRVREVTTPRTVVYRREQMI